MDLSFIKGSMYLVDCGNAVYLAERVTVADGVVLLGGKTFQMEAGAAKASSVKCIGVSKLNKIELTESV